MSHTELKTRAAPPADSCEIPAILFDGYAVFQMLTKQARARTSAENVSDVLDALVRTLRGDSPAKTAAPPSDEAAAQALRECMESGYGIVVEMVDALRLVAIMRQAAARA
jgi:hypothetical protein